jgi:hypothetical protein
MAIQLTARETNSIPKELHFSTNEEKSGLAAPYDIPRNGVLIEVFSLTVTLKDGPR